MRMASVVLIPSSSKMSSVSFFNFGSSRARTVAVFVDISTSIMIVVSMCYNLNGIAIFIITKLLEVYCAPAVGNYEDGAGRIPAQLVRDKPRQPFKPFAHKPQYRQAVAMVELNMNIVQYRISLE